MSNSNAEGEPTMEEILSSIRKIISEDEDGEGTQSSGGRKTGSEDVLELTERVGEEDSVVKSNKDCTA